MNIFTDTQNVLNTVREKMENQPKNKDDNTHYNKWKAVTQENFFLTNEKKELEISFQNDTQELTAEAKAKYKKKYFAEFDSYVEKTKKEHIEGINVLTNETFQRLEEMITKPPSGTQAQLLQALLMRKNIDVVELQRIAPVFFDNYQAIQALQDIAHANGVNVYLPIQLNIRDMIDNIEKADKFLKGAVEFIEYEINKMPQQYHAFYRVDYNNREFIQDPKYREIVYNLDNVPQLQDVKYEKTALTPVEKTHIDYLFREIPNSDTKDMKTLQVVKDIINKYPDDVRLMKLSEHKDVVNEVLEIMKEEAKK